MKGTSYIFAVIVIVCLIFWRKFIVDKRGKGQKSIDSSSKAKNYSKKEDLHKMSEIKSSEGVSSNEVPEVKEKEAYDGSRKKDRGKKRREKKKSNPKVDDLKKKTEDIKEKTGVQAKKLERDAKLKAEDAKKEAKDKSQEVKEEIKEKSQELKKDISKDSENLKAKAKNLEAETKVKAKEIKKEAEVKAEEVKEEAKDLKAKTEVKAEEKKTEAQAKAQEVKENISKDAKKVETKAEETKAETKDKAEVIKKEAEVKAENFKEESRDLKDEAEVKAEKAKEEVKEKTQEAKDQGKEKPVEVKEEIKEEKPRLENYLTSTGKYPDLITSLKNNPWTSRDLNTRVKFEDTRRQKTLTEDEITDLPLEKIKTSLRPDSIADFLNKTGTKPTVLKRKEDTSYEFTSRDKEEIDLIKNRYGLLDREIDKITSVLIFDKEGQKLKEVKDILAEGKNRIYMETKF